MLPNEIVDFYLIHAPHAHSDKPRSALSIDLATYGWTGNGPLNELMQYVVLRHLSEDGSSNIFFTAANDASSKCAELFGDFSELASKSRGAVLCMNKKLKLHDDNTCTCELTETYATCLFRHIRNAIAHGNYHLDDDAVLFLDQASDMGTANPKYTFAMLTVTSFLLEFAQTIISTYEAFSFTRGEAERLRGLTYRVPKEIVLDLKEH